MALSVVVQASAQLPAGFPVTLAALRRLGLPTVSVSGSVATGDLAAGAVTPAKVTPGAYFYAAGIKSGSAGSEVYTVTLSPALTALAAGVLMCFKADATNTGTGVRLNVNALGNVALTGYGGVALKPGDIRAGEVYAAYHNGTAWQLASLPGQPADYDAGTATGTVDAIVLTLTPSTLALSDLQGRRVRFKTSGANLTSAVTVQVNALSATPLKKHGTLALGPGDLRSGAYVEAIYDGTNFQLVSEQGVLAQYSDSVVDSGTANAYAIAPPVGGTAYSDFTGKRLRWKVTNANTGASTLAIHGIATPPAIKRAGAALEAGDLAANAYVETIYDGTQHNLVDGGRQLNIKAVHFGTTVIKSISGADTAANTLTVTGHGRSTGDKVSVGNSGGGLPGGLSAGTRYWVRAVDANTLAFYTTAADAQADTNRVDITTAGTGTNAVYYVPINASYGIDAVIYHGSGTSADQGEFTVLFNNAFASAYFVTAGAGKSATSGRSAVVAVSTSDTGAADRKRLQTRYLISTGGVAEDLAETHVQFIAVI